MTIVCKVMKLKLKNLGKFRIVGIIVVLGGCVVATASVPGYSCCIKLSFLTSGMISVLALLLVEMSDGCATGASSVATAWGLLSATECITKDGFQTVIPWPVPWRVSSVAETVRPGKAGRSFRCPLVEESCLSVSWSLTHCLVEHSILDPQWNQY